MVLDLEVCSVKEACISVGGDEKLLIELRDRLHDWLKLQPHLPQDVPMHVLDHFIIGTKMSLEQAKHKLDMFYTIRTLVPEIFTDRDPRGKNFTRMHKMIQMTHLPKLTPEKYRVCICRPIGNDFSELKPFDIMKYAIMMDETVLIDNKGRSLGHVYVLDYTNVTLGFITKFTPSLIRKCEVTVTEGYAQRIKGFYHINAAPIAETLINLFKKAVSAKLATRIHVFPKGNMESLFEYLPRSILPKDYGGDEKSIDELSELWRQELDSKRDWYLEQEKIVVNESVRPGPSVDGDSLFGFAGSFRELHVD